MERTVFETVTKIKRPVTLGNGRSSHLDKRVQFVLTELNQLFGKEVFPRRSRRDASDDVVDVASGVAARADSYSGDQRLVDVLELKLTPRRGGKNGAWSEDSLAHYLDKNEPNGEQTTLAAAIDATPALANLKHELKDYRATKPPLADPTADEILQFYPHLTDYLVAYAYHVRQIKDVRTLGAFIYDHENGARALVNYAAVSATRELVREKQLNVSSYNDDDGLFVKHILRAALPLTALSYEKSTLASINEFQFDRDEAKLIADAQLGQLPAGVEPLLIKSMQQFPIPLDSKNAKLHLPSLLAQILRTKGFADPGDIEPALDGDFDVQFHDDTDTISPDVSRSAVRCAAQLFHSMVLGDQLDVFGAVDCFTHKFLLRGGGIELRDRRLRSDLQLYVFSNRFIDLQTNRVTDRTRVAERQMFYRQVFDEGAAEVTEDMELNQEFKRLWNVLILECGKYLQRANSSFNTQYLSPQQVMQAVEDVQYNLSTACTGMVNVIGPLIDAELNFVLTRILKHPEVIQAVTPSGGTWKRAVESLCVAARRPKPRAATLYNKATYGKDILQGIADYDPATFQQSSIFDGFISTVDAFITTQSILQESVADRLVQEDNQSSSGSNSPMGANGVHEEEAPEDEAASDKPSATDEWDF